ncbi:MAG: hypothetical protein U5K69_11180 [Balneolaceae bacterium]|nr:hypothetical protein [Balneolaceae bacterium]
MKRDMVRILWGIIISTTMMVGLFYIFLIWNPLHIYNINLLRWVPVVICAAAMYISGRINKDVSPLLLPLLFIPYSIFSVFNFFYYPFFLILFFIGALAILAARIELTLRYKTMAIAGISVIFLFYLFSQPLIVEQEGFRREANGNFVNAAVLWDFTNQHLLTGNTCVL